MVILIIINKVRISVVFILQCLFNSSINNNSVVLNTLHFKLKKEFAEEAKEVDEPGCRRKLLTISISFHGVTGPEVKGQGIRHKYYPNKFEYIKDEVNVFPKELS